MVEVWLWKRVSTGRWRRSLDSSNSLRMTWRCRLLVFGRGRDTGDSGLAEAQEGLSVNYACGICTAKGYPVRTIQCVMGQIIVITDLSLRRIEAAQAKIETAS